MSVIHRLVTDDSKLDENMCPQIYANGSVEGKFTKLQSN